MDVVLIEETASAKLLYKNLETSKVYELAREGS